MNKIKVMFVCLGNICRSPMAESLFTHMVKERGLESRFLIASSATSSYEVGNPVHPGTVAKLKKMKVELVDHRAIQLKKEDYEVYDYIIGMDESNIKDIKKITGKEDKVYSILSFAGEDRSVKDPWYTGNFDETYEDLVKGLDGFLSYLEEKGDI